MEDLGVVVDAYVATDESDLSLREDAWSIAMDQQAFGPGRMVVAAADRSGRLLAFAYAAMTAPADVGLAFCLEHLAGIPVTSEAAVVYTDEPVRWGPPPSDLEFRFHIARKTAERFGVHLVDWFLCDADSELIRSARIAVEPGSEWWDLP